jgi:AcrR family transcriptional regulator
MDKKQVKKDRLKAKRQKQILTASMKVFSRYGYQDTDVEKIADLAGLGKGTVYRYFKSKENLFLSTLEWGLNSLKENIFSSIAKVDDYMDKLKLALATHFKFFEKHRDFFRLLVQERAWTEMKSARCTLRERDLSIIRHLKDILSEGMRKGYLKKADPSSCAYALWGLTNSLLYKYLISEKKYPIDKELSVIHKIFFEGILNEKKRRKR